MIAVKLDENWILKINTTELDFSGGIVGLIEGYPFGEAIRNGALEPTYNGNTATMKIDTPEHAELLRLFLNEYHETSTVIYDPRIGDIRTYDHRLYATADGGYDSDGAKKARDAVIAAVSSPVVNNQPTSTPYTIQAPNVQGNANQENSLMDKVGTFFGLKK